MKHPAISEETRNFVAVKSKTSQQNGLITNPWALSLYKLAGITTIKYSRVNDPKGTRY